MDSAQRYTLRNLLGVYIAYYATRNSVHQVRGAGMIGKHLEMLTNIDKFKEIPLKQKQKQSSI